VNDGDRQRIFQLHGVCDGFKRLRTLKILQLHNYRLNVSGKGSDEAAETSIQVNKRVNVSMDGLLNVLMLIFSPEHPT